MTRLEKASPSSSLYEVLDRTLDMGVVIDTSMNVSILGINLVSISTRIVCCSVNTWLKYTGVLCNYDDTEDETTPNNTLSISLPFPIRIRCNGLTLYTNIPRIDLTTL